MRDPLGATEAHTMRTSNLSHAVILFAASLLCACAVNRPVALTPDASGLAAFLDARHPADILVTDATGHSQMVHNPQLDGDTLRGLRNRDLPRERVSIPLGSVQGVAVPEFSAGRTLGLTGGILAVAAVGLLIVVGNGPQPVY